MPHFTFVIEGWTHFNEAVRSENATRSTELLFFLCVFVCLWTSGCTSAESTAVASFEQRNQWDCASHDLFETHTHPYIHLSVYLSTHPFFHPSIQHRHVCAFPSSLMEAYSWYSWEHSRIELRRSFLSFSFSFFNRLHVDWVALAHLSDIKKQRDSLLWKGCGVDRE